MEKKLLLQIIIIHVIVIIHVIHETFLIDIITVILLLKIYFFYFQNSQKKKKKKNWIYYSTITSDWNWIKSTKKPKFPIINKEKEDLSLPILPKIKTPSPIQTQTTFRKKRPKIPKNSN